MSYANGSASRHTCWSSVECRCFVSLSQNVPDKEWDPRNNTLSQTSGSHLSVECPGQLWPHIHIYYELLGHCLKILSFKENILVISCLTDSQNIKLITHVSAYIKITVHSFARTLLIPFRVVDITGSNWDTYFHFSKYIMLDSWKRVVSRAFMIGPR